MADSGERKLLVKGTAYRLLMSKLQWYEDFRLVPDTGTPLATSWYELLPLVHCSTKLARSKGRSVPVYANAQGLVQAKFDAQHQFRSALSNPLAALPRIWDKYFNFGECVLGMEQESATVTRHEIHLRSLPRVVQPWLGSAQLGYVLGLLEESGCSARGFAAREVSGGFDRGFATVHQTLVVQLARHQASVCG